MIWRLIPLCGHELDRRSLRENSGLNLNKPRLDQIQLHWVSTQMQTARSCISTSARRRLIGAEAAWATALKKKLFFTFKAKADVNICLKVQKGNPQVHALQIILLHTPLLGLQISCSPSP